MAQEKHSNFIQCRQNTNSTNGGNISLKSLHVDQWGKEFTFFTNSSFLSMTVDSHFDLLC